MHVTSSVTRCCEISQLWQFLKSFIYFLAKFCTYFGKFYAIGLSFIVVKGQIMKHDRAIWSHWQVRNSLDTDNDNNNCSNPAMKKDQWLMSRAASHARTGPAYRRVNHAGRSSQISTETDSRTLAEG